MTVGVYIFLGIAYLYFSLLLLYRRCWAKQSLRPRAPGPNSSPLPFLSVIVAARNEEQNIANCIRSILSNSYRGQFEVIVVDDHSTDATVDIVKTFPGVKLVPLKDGFQKKQAIAAGIMAMRGEIVVCTDADCTCPPNWLQDIGECYCETGFAMLLMPVELAPQKSADALYVFQSLDFMCLQGITGGSAAAHKPVMCNGANIAYTKRAFELAGGFGGNEKIASGDDMFLMQKIHKQWPAKVLFLQDTDALVRTAAPQGLAGFFEQRKRWAGKAVNYRELNVIAVSLVVFLFNLLMLALPFFCIFHNPRIDIFCLSVPLLALWSIVLLLKTGIELYFVAPVAKFFGKEKFIKYFPLAEPFHIVYTVFAAILGFFQGYEWKGRFVRPSR